MHPMRPPGAKAVLPLFLLVLVSPAAAELIRPEHAPTAPEIAGAIAGAQSHSYDSATRTGRFEASTIPYLLTLGSTAGDDADILPDQDGVRSQTVRLILDEYGQLVRDPTNTFTVRGIVTLRGQTYRGVLLRGTPTAFRANRSAPKVFELNLSITGGALAPLFGPDAYVRLQAGRGDAFEGDFRQNFNAEVEESSLVALHAPREDSSPVAEPTAVAILLACGSWLFVRKRALRLSRRPLSTDR